PSAFPVYLFRLNPKNALRHKLRIALTMVGIVVAINAFGLLRTIVDAWYTGNCALPLLWRDNVIGWGNAAVGRGRLEVDPGFIGTKPCDAVFGCELDAGIARMTSFLGMTGSG